MLIVKNIKDSDYDNLFCKWWEEWGWESPPSRDFLPGNGAGGVVVYSDNIPVCAGFLYATNSGVAWIDWIVSDPKFREKPTRRESLDLLVASLLDVARAAGYKYAYSLVDKEHAMSPFLRNGFTKGHKYNIELIKKL